MEGTLFGYLGKYTVVSLLISYLVLILSNSSFSFNDGLNLEMFQNGAIALGFTVLLIYVMIYSAMVEKYDHVLRTCFRKPMLRYTVAKKQFENGNYEIEGNPRKSYDNLPQLIKTEIDKLDSSLHSQEVPKLLDLLIASFNSVILLTYGLFVNLNILYIIVIGIFSIYFIYFLMNSYMVIKNIILQDYMSLFEESK